MGFSLLNALGGLMLVAVVVMFASLLGWIAHLRTEEDIGGGRGN